MNSILYTLLLDPARKRADVPRKTYTRAKMRRRKKYGEQVSCQVSRANVREVTTKPQTTYTQNYAY